MRRWRKRWLPALRCCDACDGAFKASTWTLIRVSNQAKTGETGGTFIIKPVLQHISRRGVKESRTVLLSM